MARKTILKIGQIIEDWDTRLQIIHINGEHGVVKMMDSWDKYSRGGPAQGCFSSYLDKRGEYSINRGDSCLESEGEEYWIFEHNPSYPLSCLNRHDSNLIIWVIDNKVRLDMDT